MTFSWSACGSSLTAAAVAWLMCAGAAWAAEPASPLDAGLVPITADGALMAQAEAAVKAGDLKGAEALFRELCRRTPGAARPHRGLGTTLLGLEKVDEALAELQRSVALEDSAAARYNIGFAYGKKGDYGKAADSFRASVKLQADYPLGWSYLVDALARADRHTEAIETVTEAREKCAQCRTGAAFTRNVRPLALYHQGKAAALFQEGKLELAETGEAVVLKIDPDFADAYYNLGKIAVARGKMDVAEAMYRKALARYRPEEAQPAADAKNNLAFLLAGRDGGPAGRVGGLADRSGGREAVSLVRAAIAVRGERPSYLDTLGRACDAVNDKACAREAYRKLLQKAGAEVPAEATAHAKERLAALETAGP